MKKQNYISIIFALISTFALIINYQGFYERGLKNIKSMVQGSIIVSAIVFIALAFFYVAFYQKKYKSNWLQKIVSLFFAIMMLVGKSFEITNSFSLIFKSKLTLLVATIGIIGYFILFDVIFHFLNYVISNKILTKGEKIKNSFLIKFFNERPFMSSFITILIFWMIYLIAFYPGVLTPDASYEILQAFNIHTKYSDWVIQLDPNVNITNHHPVLYTLFLGICVKIGQTVSNDNFGIFLATIIQVLILSSTLAYTIKYLKKIGVSYKIREIILLLYCMVPMFPFYAVTNVKDTIYTAFVILYIVQLYDFIKFYKNEKVGASKIVYWLFLMLMIALFRNNGIYVVTLSFVFAVFYSKMNRGKMLALLTIYLVLYKICYMGILLPYFKIPNTSTREMLSVPFQQTARYVKYHKNELTEEEKEAIDKVIIYRTLGKRYKPELADPVKNQYNKYTTNEELKQYFRVWFQQLRKDPMCYVESFINNTYGYFYPTNKDWYLYYNYKNIVNKEGNINYHFIKPLTSLRKLLKNYGNAYRTIPVVGLISNIGVNTCLILVYGVYFIMQKEKRKYLIVLLPHLITLLFCLLSPVNNYFRYAMPYIFAMPITTVIWLKEITEKGETINEQKR